MVPILESRDCIHKTSFSSQITLQSNKLVFASGKPFEPSVL
jgi:hypothetical protein